MYIGQWFKSYLAVKNPSLINYCNINWNVYSAIGVYNEIINKKCKPRRMTSFTLPILIIGLNQYMCLEHIKINN